MHRVFQRLGQIGEQFGHLGLCLEILRRAVIFGPPRIAQHIAFGDAHTGFMCLVIVLVEKLYRMCGDQRQAKTCSEIGTSADEHFLCWRTIHRASIRPLHFNVVSAGK